MISSIKVECYLYLGQGLLKTLDYEISDQIYQSCLSAFLTFASKSYRPLLWYPCTLDLKSEHQEQEQEQQEQQENETVKTKKAPLREGPNKFFTISLLGNK